MLLCPWGRYETYCDPRLNYAQSIEVALQEGGAAPHACVRARSSALVAAYGINVCVDIVSTSTAAAAAAAGCLLKLSQCYWPLELSAGGAAAACANACAAFIPRISLTL